MHIPWDFTPKTRSILTTNRCRPYGSVYSHFLQNVSRVWNAMPDCTKKGADRSPPQKLSSDAVKQSGDSRQFLSYLMEPVKNALVHLLARMSPAGSIMSNLLDIDAASLRYRFPRHQFLRIMQHSPCGEMPFDIQFSLQFCRNGLPVLTHAFNMELQRLDHIPFQLIQSPPGRYAGYICIRRSSRVVVCPVNIDYDLSHNKPPFYLQGGYFHPACFQMLFKINWSSVADGFSFTVTRPFLTGCLYCL